MSTPTVLVFGTFDVLHPGHVALLAEAARLGKVIVSLTPDELCRQYKGKPSHHSFSVRRQRLLRLRSVSDVVASDIVPHSYTTVTTYRPAVVLLGYDQRLLREGLIKKIKEEKLLTRIVVAKSYRPEIYHSSILANFA